MAGRKMISSGPGARSAKASKTQSSSLSSSRETDMQIIAKQSGASQGEGGARSLGETKSIWGWGEGRLSTGGTT